MGFTTSLFLFQPGKSVREGWIKDGSIKDGSVSGFPKSWFPYNPLITAEPVIVAPMLFLINFLRCMISGFY
jgi:hypothetical protein